MSKEYTKLSLVKDSNGQDGDGVDDAPARYSEEEKRAWRHAKMELAWLPDRATLSQRIEKGLREGSFDLCLAMARLVSKKPNEAVAAWNLLIKYRMEQKPLPHCNKALALFNEVRFLLLTKLSLES